MKLHNALKFFAAIRQNPFGKALAQPQVDGTNHLLKAMGDAGWPIAWTAYGLATAFHEVAGTMQPIRERGSGDRDRDGEDDHFEKYDTGRIAAALGNTPADDNDGEKWCGRGYPQVTGAANYAKIDAALGLDGTLIANPALMLQPRIAADGMVWAMKAGAFTGKALKHYLPPSGLATRAEFRAARRIINGMDRADDIAGYALAFQDALAAGQWRAH